jgi:hypothetical protein
MQPEYKDVINYRDGLNGDIIKVLESNFAKAKKQTKHFCEQFEAGNLLDTCQNVWDYVKNNIPYKADGTAEQKIILPARMVARAENGIGADCKSFALFCASNISNLYPNADVNFRYTCYRGSKTPSHVYCVVKTSKGIIKIDPVWHYFNKEKEYKHKIDHSMRIATLSGTGDKVKVDAQTYETLKALKTAIDAYPVGSPQWNLFTRQFNVVATSAGLNDPSINGRFKDRLKNAFKGAVNAVKKLEKKVEKGLKDLKQNIVSKPEWANKTDYVKHLAKMGIPLFIEMRVAFLLALTINFRNLCNRILDEEKKEPHKIQRLWYKGFGGDPKALMAACEANKNKKALFGKPKGVKGYYDGITIGDAETDDAPKKELPKSAAGAAGAAASSIALIAGANPAGAAAISSAVVMAFTIIAAMLKNMPKHKNDDDTDGDHSGGDGGGSGDGDGGGGSGDGDGGGGSGDGDGSGNRTGNTEGSGDGTGSGSGSGSGLDFKKYLTPKNLIIGGAAVAALLIIPKLINQNKTNNSNG